MVDGVNIVQIKHFCISTLSWNWTGAFSIYTVAENNVLLYKVKVPFFVKL